MNELLAERIDAQLPQTQCTRCGYPDCAAYAAAVAAREVNLNRCPPGGTATIAQLAELLNVSPVALDRDCGEQGPRRVAFVDESWCIGCTLCIIACPVDAIVGAAKRMHTIIESLCTGCELCIAPCPVECIHMEAARSGPTGPVRWLRDQAPLAKQRYLARNRRLAAPAAIHVPENMQDGARRKRLISQAVARSKARRGGPGSLES
jgi:electron transport complex protein RnfB